MQLHTGVALSKGLPFSQKGAVGVSRLRDYLRLLSAKLTEELLSRTSCAPLVNPSVTAYAVTPPFDTKGRLWGRYFILV